MRKSEYALWALLVFASAMAAWLGGWFVFRAAIYLYERFLANPWK